MAKNNIGSLVVLKPEEQHIAGIITERGKLISITFVTLVVFHGGKL